MRSCERGVTALMPRGRRQDRHAPGGGRTSALSAPATSPAPAVHLPHHSHPRSPRNGHERHVCIAVRRTAATQADDAPCLDCSRIDLLRHTTPRDNHLISRPKGRSFQSARSPCAAWMPSPNTAPGAAHSPSSQAPAGSGCPRVNRTNVLGVCRCAEPICVPAHRLPPGPSRRRKPFLSRPIGHPGPSRAAGCTARRVRNRLGTQQTPGHRGLRPQRVGTRSSETPPTAAGWALQFCQRSS